MPVNTFRKALDSLVSMLPFSSPDPEQIAGQVALITGAGNGLGRQISIKLAKLNCKLVLWDLDERANEETKAICESLGAEVYAYRVDVSDRKEIYSVAERVMADVGAVRILVNNAGILRAVGSFLSKADEDIEATVRVNMMAHMWMAKAFLPTMIERDAGHIVCVSSMSGIVGLKFIVEYSSSKFGALGFQEALETETHFLNGKNIHFTTICPIYIRTGMLKGVTLPPSTITLSPDDVAEEIVHAILVKKRIVMLPRKAYLVYAAKGLLPHGVFQRLMLYVQR
ncbi:hypothetical protein KIN20_031339 [Parelaphostrongylus tenuis]|uniref:Short-chain dehydrogenase/reductase 3 n=1 Tax=Parelaphostrongylus tenuis TaxID=148309 RepID=A0AAD5R6K7_PARTN|nr:hypothetical protein KIN20_031339 [Parelaphostrongylus tenuis]